MAWVTPVTDRQTGSARMTCTDMDRITGNIDHVFNLITGLGYTVSGSTVSQTSWSQNDIITTTFWTSMLTVLDNICDAIEYTPRTAPDSLMTYTNINNIESITLYLYNYATADYLLTHAGVAITTETEEQILATI